MSSGTQRFGTAGTGSPPRGDGVYINNASNIKLINLIVHDVGHGTYTENSAHNIEIYGWIIYNGGVGEGARAARNRHYTTTEATASQTRPRTRECHQTRFRA